MVLREDRNELGFEDAVDVARHGAEQDAGGRSYGDPRRYRRAAGADLDERARERLQQAVDIEQAHDVGLREEEQTLAHDADEAEAVSCEGAGAEPEPFPWCSGRAGITGRETCVGWTSFCGAGASWAS